jgi:hypothetical protein
VLTLGGIWAGAAHPASRDSFVTLVASLLLVAMAAAGLVVTLRAGRTLSAVGLGAAWLAPPALAVLVSAGPGLRAFTALQGFPGVALARDTHRWLGPAAFATAALTGLAVEALAQWVRRREPSAAAAAATGAAGATVVAASLAVLSVPDLPAAVYEAYRPVTMPADWAPMLAAADRAAGDGTVLSTPWLALRQTGWNGAQRPFLDPLPRALHQHVASSRELIVVRSDEVVVVDADQTAIAAAVRSGRVDSAALAHAGITAVVEWRGTPGPALIPDSGLRQVFSGPDFRVWAVTRGS